MTEIPKMALSIQQPWAWLIVNGHKDIENRKWATPFRGPVAIHAGKKVDEENAQVTCWRHPGTGELADFNSGESWREQLGGIVGVAEIVDCVEHSESPWFFGRFGFVIRNARPVEFVPVRGQLGFFDWRKQL